MLYKCSSGIKGHGVSTSNVSASDKLGPFYLRYNCMLHFDLMAFELLHGIDGCRHALCNTFN